jgi:hypothetical protein
MDAGGRAALRRILCAYSRRNATVGYCQGLNFLAATFLLLLPEEQAFWCLAALVERVLGSSYFDERMAAPQVSVHGHIRALQILRSVTAAAPVLAGFTRCGACLLRHALFGMGYAAVTSSASVRLLA